jgi:hypothetical protein
MKRLFLTLSICIFSLLSLFVNAQNSVTTDEFISEIRKGIPEEFKLDESGLDKKNIYAVFKKTPQEVITVNLQKDYNIDFPDQETSTINNRKTIFYYAGFNKSAGLVVFLNNDSGYLVFGYNKPYMGEEIVKKEELIEIVKNIDLIKFE